MKRSLGLILLVLWATGCATGPGPKEVMGRYLDAYGQGKNEEAYSLLSTKDKSAKSLDAFSESEGSGFKAILGPKVSYQVTEIRTRGDKAKATVEMKTPDIKGVFGELLGTILTMAFGGEQDHNALEKLLAERVQGKNWPTTTRTEYYDLVKEEDGWKVFLNYEGIDKSKELKYKAESLEKQKRYPEARSALEEAMKLNPKDTEIPGKIKEMDKKAAEDKERQMYFDKIEVRNTSIGQRDPDPFGVFAVTDVEFQERDTTRESYQGGRACAGRTNGRATTSRTAGDRAGDSAAWGCAGAASESVRSWWHWWAAGCWESTRWRSWA